MAKQEIKAVNADVAAVARKAWLAYIGGLSTAYENFQTGVEKVRTQRQAILAELIEKGEEVEGSTKENLAKARADIEEKVQPGLEKVRAFVPAMPKTKNAQVAELSAEIEKLNKKVASLTKKTATKTKARSTTKAAA